MFQLPIDSLQAEFDQHVKHHHLVVEAETGSGKSTRLPLWAAKHGRVLVIEPRRIACTSLAEFLAEQSGEPIGNKIGYAIKLHAFFDENTEVVFVTPGVALRWFAEDKLASFDIVIVDEFHERRWDIDLLTAILKQENQHRLIVTSATLEGEKLAHYLNAHRLRSEGRCFPVSVAHRVIDSRHLPNKKGCENDVVKTVKEALEDEEGDILVFLPGRKEITQCAQMLQHLDDVLVVKLHASVSDEERHRALTVQAQRKVVLATNVAETSLTIPNIRVVIDSGLERRTVQRNGRTALTLTNISKASAAQRMGRAGRVAEGTCIRLFGEHAPLELVTPPELHPELMFVRRERRRDALGNGLMEMVVGRNSRFPDKSEAALVLDSHSVPGRGVKQTLNLASVMMPISLDLIKTLELGEWHQGDTQYEDDTPLATMHLVYAGRTIFTEHQALQGEVAIQSIVDMIEQEMLLPGFAPLRKQQIQHWKIYNSLGLNTELVDKKVLDELCFSTWLTEQLATLGVESVDDIELFEADDLPFEGIPEWEYNDFAEQYPLKLVLAELKLDVEYFVSRKLVHVIYTEGNRKGDPKRWELPRWAGWKVQYKKASRVVDVK
ncbi:ATP-dependent helicase HrpA [Vibrio parahaemolyticus]|uniref:helicase-related protein n=1 Tax=Vibrio parahaemolyticus TaxID=670 RepID=UPI0009B6695D|nr:helicase-related protein [Vibrio parahaemolyticus]OQK28243.1 ATP-dependent helicase HrpA [Vibrio parahaemolyticus]